MQGITTGVLSHRAGNPMGWTTLDPTTLSPTLYGLAAGAPHPCSAMLFLDFILSSEGQALSDQAEGTITSDELTSHTKEGVSLAPHLDVEKPLASDQLQQWMALFDQLVVRK